MVDEGFYEVFWTSDFSEDVYGAVSYISNTLGSPKAARNLLESIVASLEAKRAMPTAAPSFLGSTGILRYVVSVDRWDVYYVIEGRVIKAIGLKHQLQKGPRGILPRDK